jgi:hypothetical protein
VVAALVGVATRARALFRCLGALWGDGFLAHENLRGPIEADPARNPHVPVIGVAKSGWSIDQFFGRARVSLAQYAGGVDEREFANGDFAERMLPCIRYPFGGNEEKPAAKKGDH